MEEGHGSRRLPDGVRPQLLRLVQNVFGYDEKNAERILTELTESAKEKELVRLPGKERAVNCISTRPEQSAGRRLRHPHSASEGPKPEAGRAVGFGSGMEQGRHCLESHLRARPGVVDEGSGNGHDGGPRE